jgi:hypothetical protein
MPAIRVEPVRTKQGRRSFVKFPWQIYKDDANWVPPLIPERLEYPDPERGLFTNTPKWRCSRRAGMVKQWGPSPPLSIVTSSST